MSHISGKAVAALANAVQSMEDAGMPDSATLFAYNPKTKGYAPILYSDDEQPEAALTVAHLKALLEPFKMWM